MTKALYERCNNLTLRKFCSNHILQYHKSLYYINISSNNSYYNGTDCLFSKNIVISNNKENNLVIYKNLSRISTKIDGASKIDTTNNFVVITLYNNRSARLCIMHYNNLQKLKYMHDINIIDYGQLCITDKYITCFTEINNQYAISIIKIETLKEQSIIYLWPGIINISDTYIKKIDEQYNLVCFISHDYHNERLLYIVIFDTIKESFRYLAHKIEWNTQINHLFVSIFL